MYTERNLCKNEYRRVYPPKDQELFPGETYDINEEYLLYMDKAAFGGGQYITFPIWGVEVQTIEEKDKDPALEETEICTVEEKDRGWQIEAKRPGTARVILTYRDYAYEAEQYSFLISYRRIQVQTSLECYQGGS